jgi:hypothetical protein
MKVSSCVMAASDLFAAPLLHSQFEAFKDGHDMGDRPDCGRRRNLDR